MILSEIIQKRRSIRNFKPDPIPEDSLNKILEAGRLAPSAHNSQNWKFVVVKDSEKKVQLSKAASQDFIANASVIVVLVSLDPENVMSCGVPAWAVDLSIAASYMVLQAWEEGLGTCWIGAFSQEKVKEVINVPEEFRVVTMLPFGSPNENPDPRPRKKREEVVSFENF